MTQTATHAAAPVLPAPGLRARLTTVPGLPCRLRRWTLALCAAVGAVGGASAAPPAPLPGAEPHTEIRFESVGVGAIPRDVVATLAQDRAGFLWVATGDGLVRYDGYNFRQQERESVRAAERSLGWVRALLPARDGRVWIATETEGLAVYDPLDGRITLRGGHDDADGESAGSARAVPSIHALAEGADGTVWMGTLGSGLSAYDPVTRRTTTYRHTGLADGLPDDRVQSLLVDRNGTLWIGTWRGLARREAHGTRFVPVASGAGGTLSGLNVRRLAEAADGRIWVGTQNGLLAVIDPATHSSTVLEGAAAEGAVTSFAQPEGGPMWVGRATGIEIRAADTGQLIRQLRHNPRRAHSLGASDISTLLVDRAGWIWVGGYGTGLQRHNPGNRSIAVRGVDLQADGLFQNADVRHLLQVGVRDIWAVTPMQGVAVMNAALSVTAHVPLPERGGGGRVDAMAQTADGSVWLATDTALHAFNAERRPLRSVAHSAGRTNRLLGGRDGTLWVATQDGLWQLPPGDQTLRRVAHDGGSALTGEVYALAEAPDASVWIGTHSGLYRISADGSSAQAVASDRGRGLANPSVIGLLFDRRGGLWLDTAVAGLHRMTGWDGRQARFDRISERHGIVGRPFGANLLEDARGRIWTQMTVYDPALDHLHELTRADGVDLGTGWFGAYTKAADGRMLFGGSKGLLVVRPERFDPAAHEPPLVVSELRINGRHIPQGPHPQRVVLQSDDRSFGVEIAALEFSEPRRVRYAYRLDGFDPDWIRTGADFRVASYTNLPPGDYVLHARATNRGGDWGNAELRIEVTVLPAWWESTWFHLLLLPLAAALLFCVVHGRTRWHRQRQHQLEVKVQRRTAELHALSRTLQAQSAALEAASLSDPLTGMHNRRFLTAHIERDVALSLRRHEARSAVGAPPVDADLAFFLVDLDHFKQINDAHGHAGGDAVLMQMRARLQQVFRACDHLVRWGGEEFLVVALGTAREHAADLAERVRSVVADTPFTLDGDAPLAVTCSVGFACYPLALEHPRALDWPEIVNLADAALYEVKRTGRNGWRGVVRARGASADALRECAAGPLDAWRDAGTLDTVGSR